MKGDYSRLTFDPRAGVRAVTYQQGRPLDDASLNEAAEVLLNRVETEAVDVIGRSGAPLEGGGFRLVTALAQLTAAEAADPRNAPTPAVAGAPLLLTAGRLYVEGLQVTNHALTSLGAQPVPLDAVAALAGPGRKLVYLRVEIDHQTAVEQSRLLDPAYGDVDTTARQTIRWQVRVVPVGANDHCASALAADWEKLAGPLQGRIAVTVDTGASATDPCRLTAGSGYARPENLLYRVEVDDGVAVSNVDGDTRYGRDGLVVKVSRNNALEVATIAAVNGNQITVDTGSRDGMPIFRVGDYLEFLDAADPSDVGRRVGWTQIEAVDAEVVTVTSAAGAAVGRRARMWSTDRITLTAQNGHAVTLDGIRFAFSNDGYRRGTCFLVPARYATGDVLLTAAERAALAPAGPRVEYLRLGLIDVGANGVVQPPVQDCRPVFVPLTALESFHYVGGDGQDALPGETLPRPLQVRVARGRVPVAGAKVRFRAAANNGVLSPMGGGNPLAQLDVDTNADGIAACRWTLDASPLPASRHVSVNAAPLDAAGIERAGNRVVFGATKTVTIVQHAGDGQDAAAGAPLPQPLEVRVGNGQTPLVGASVQFVVTLGSGQITSALPALTDNQGVARADWQLGASGIQRVEARLVDGAGSVAQAVAFDAQIRPAVAAGGCAVTVGKGGQFDALTSELLKKLLAESDGRVCVCLLAGDHLIEKLDVNGGGKAALSIHGCGQPSRLLVRGPMRWRGLAALQIGSLAMTIDEGAGLQFEAVREVELSDLAVQAAKRDDPPVLSFEKSRRIVIDRCTVESPTESLTAVFQDSEAATSIDDSTLDGTVSFYGRPAKVTLPVADLQVPTLRRVLAAGGGGDLQPGRGRLTLHGNRLEVAQIGADMVVQLQKLANATPAQPVSVGGLYADAVVVGNSFGALGSQLVAARATLSGNAFTAPLVVDRTVATLVAQLAAATGNVGAVLDKRYVVRLATSLSTTPAADQVKAGNAVTVDG